MIFAFQSNACGRKLSLDFICYQNIGRYILQSFGGIEIGTTTKRFLGDSDSLSSLLESQRIITCKELYSILGQLMSHYKDNPIRVADFFDLTLLRANTKKVPTTVFSGQITDFNTGRKMILAVAKMILAVAKMILAVAKMILAVAKFEFLEFNKTFFSDYHHPKAFVFKGFLLAAIMTRPRPLP